MTIKITKGGLRYAGSSLTVGEAYDFDESFEQSCVSRGYAVYVPAYGDDVEEKTACIIGNSLGYQERRQPSGGYYQSFGNGLFEQINQRSGQHFKLLNIKAADGIRLSTILDNFETGVRPHAPDYVFCLGALENEVANAADATTVSSQLSALLTKCRSIGAKLIITAMTPGGSIITTTAMRDKWYELNRVMLDLFWGVKDVCMLRTDTILADPTQTYPTPISGGYTDGAWHWYQRGASLIADTYISQISNFVGGFRDPFNGTWSASMTDVNALVGNPFNTGSAAAGSGLTGTVPGSGVSFSLGGTGSGAASLVSRLSDGVPGNWCQVVYSGPASPVWNTDRVRGNTSNVSISSAGLAVGDVIQGLWEVECSAASAGFMGFQIFVIFTGSTGTYGRAYGNVQNNGAGVLAPLLTTTQGKRVLATPPLAIQTGTTGLQLFVEAHPSGASASFTVKFGRHAYRKLDGTWY